MTTRLFLCPVYRPNTLLNSEFLSDMNRDRGDDVKNHILNNLSCVLTEKLDQNSAKKYSLSYQ